MIFINIFSRKRDIFGLECIGCDGCPTNTGKHEGIIRLLELKLNRPLQWSVCDLNGNELSLKALFMKLDSKTSGTHDYSVPTGKSLSFCEKLPIINCDAFESVKCPDPPIADTRDLSSDQRYLMNMWRAVKEGTCSKDLAGRSLGKLYHARWLTLANKILQSFIETENTSYQLRALVKFIMRVYAPMWCESKCKPTIKDALKHLSKSIFSSRYLERNLGNCVQKVIQNNAYFAHPGNLILAMLCNKRQRIRKLAAPLIISASQSSNM